MLRPYFGADDQLVQSGWEGCVKSYYGEVSSQVGIGKISESQ